MELLNNLDSINTSNSQVIVPQKEKPFLIYGFVVLVTTTIIFFLLGGATPVFSFKYVSTLVVSFLIIFIVSKIFKTKKPDLQKAFFLGTVSSLFGIASTVVVFQPTSWVGLAIAKAVVLLVGFVLFMYLSKWAYSITTLKAFLFSLISKILISLLASVYFLMLAPLAW